MAVSSDDASGRGADPSPAVVVVVGAGPRATGLLERIAANAPELWDGGRALEIHLVDPCPPGAGRVWRPDQSPLLRMNSMAQDVTMFTDENTQIDGPVVPGPTLARWAAAPREHPPYREPADPAVRDELRDLAPTGFATRRAQSAYLDWVFRRTLAALPPHITVRVHRDRATALTGRHDGPQYVHLAHREVPLAACLVVLTQGHLSARPGPAQLRLADFAHRHGRTYVPPEYSSDADLSGLAAGEGVIVRGLGLSFVDLVVLLTEGRGGSYTTESDGALRYVPSGREPVLHVGSRRGVPYYAKTGYPLQGPRPGLPRYFGQEALAPLLEAGRPLDIREDLWPLMAKEIGYGHYHELFHAHPERTRLPWAEFLDAYDRCAQGSPEMDRLIGRAVPAEADRIDCEQVDEPLRGRTFDGPEQLQEWLRGHVTRDIERRGDPGRSADLGAFHGLLSVFGGLGSVIGSGLLTTRSVARDLDGWWNRYFNSLASGPPAFRLRELLALSRAGVVHFLGAGLEVEADERTGTFRASSASVPGHTVTGTALVEARQPGPSLDRTVDPLLRALYLEGAVEEETLVDPTDPASSFGSGRMTVVPENGRVVDPGLGGPHPRRVALGSPTNGRGVTAFARPCVNNPTFRHNDEAARALLRSLAVGTRADADRTDAGGTDADGTPDGRQSGGERALDPARSR